MTGPIVPPVPVVPITPGKAPVIPDRIRLGAALEICPAGLRDVRDAISGP